MSTNPTRFPRLAGLAAALAASTGPAWAYEAGLTYVKMSLTVPWTLYFVFLACVLIPFVVMVVLAWRSGPSEKPAAPKDGRGNASPGRAEP